MSKMLARWVNYDSWSMQDLSDALGVLPAPGGALERTPTGLAIAEGELDATHFDVAFLATIAFLGENETVSGNWTFSAIPACSVAPTSANHLANKAYVDAARAGLDVKDSVRAATTVAGGNITLSGEQTIDGVVLLAGDRVLVKNQTTGSQNGFYLVAVGAWSRTTDADGAGEVTAGAYTFVDEGTVNGGTGWILRTPNPIVLGTTSLTFAQFNGSGGQTAGAGILATGSVWDIVAANDSITVNADSIQVRIDGTTIEVASGIGLRVKANSIGASHITTGVAGAGLTGGNGTALSVVAAALIRGGAVAIDADLLEISYVPTNYTRSVTAPATNAEHLTAHLVGIDNALDALPQSRTQLFTLDATAITNEYVTLAAAPATANRVRLHIRGAPGQFYGADFAMDGSVPTRLSWSGLGLDGQLIAGDQLTVVYEI